MAAAWRATLSIEGMTCASCVGNITRAVDALPFVTSISMNLLTASAEAVLSDKSHVNDVVQTIEDAGYDAEALTLQPVDPDVSKDAETRTVQLQVEGATSSKDLNDLKSLLLQQHDSRITAVNPSIQKNRYLLTITYKPSPLLFTIRTILHTLNAHPPTIASFYMPPSPEQRAATHFSTTFRRLSFRLLATFLLAIPTFLIGIVWTTLLPAAHPLHLYFLTPILSGSVSRSDWALLFLSTPVYFFAADVFHRKALRELWSLWRPASKARWSQRLFRFGSMNLLLSLGTSIAYWSSIGSLIAGARAEKAGGAMYFDTVVFLTMFILAGRTLELYGKRQTSATVDQLSELRPDSALLVEPGSEKRSPSSISTALIEIGDTLLVPPAASPPADGVLLESPSSASSVTFDESSLTGESRPVHKRVGDVIHSGTINISPSPIFLRVTALPSASLLEKIIAVVREGAATRAPIERLADRITGYFVPLVTFLALTTFVLWLALGLGGHVPASWLVDASADATDSSGTWGLYALQFAVSVFVVACPCGIGLAAPTALFVGSGLAAKYGVLVKGGGEAFQEAAGVEVVCFDKTGTLTLGTMDVMEHQVGKETGLEERVLWNIVERMEEQGSSHPVASALLRFSRERRNRDEKAGTSVEDIQVETLPGQGLRGTATLSDGRRYNVLLGNEALLESHNCPFPPTTSAILQTWTRASHSIALLAIQLISQPSHTPSYELAASFAISQTPVPSAAPTIAALQKSGVAVHMLTGDNPTTALSVATTVNIPPQCVHASLTPEGKKSVVETLQRGDRKRRIVAMVGDGVNDTPAFATADVSVAVAGGADAVIASAAGFVILPSSSSEETDLTRLLTLVRLSKAVMRRVKWNFGWALGYNMIALPVAAGVLMRATDGKGRLDAVWASLAMAMSSLSVVGSSLALKSRAWGVGFRDRAEGRPASQRGR